MQASQTLSPSMSMSFKEFLFRDKKNRTILLIALALIAIQFSFFKYLYPFASYIHGDSFSYLEAAARNLDISTYPIGYSRFLRLFSVFFRADIILVAFQYLCIQAGTLFLLFTIFYFYTPLKAVRYGLLGFMVLNPLLLHLANLVSSDCLFVALSMTWFALLLWIVQQPTKRIIIWQAVVLFLAFTVRYNAIIYPGIALVAFSVSKLPLRKKILGAGLGALLCCLFVLYTSYHYNKLTGYWQFSPFSGWLMANNAMYAYRYVDSADRMPVPQKFRMLDNMIRQYFDTSRNLRENPQEAMMASTIYMWTPRMSLMKYRDSLFRLQKDTMADEHKKWASMGPFYKTYGLYIIKKYPWHFVRYYLWPNSLKYYAPPVEFLEDYNSGNSIVTTQAQRWFGYKSQEVKVRMGDKNVWILDFYPILSGIINVVILFGIIYYLILKGWHYNSHFNKILIMMATVWLLNAGFTIFISSAALRFQSFPVLLSTVLVCLLADWMVQLIESIKSDKGVRQNSLGKPVIRVDQSVNKVVV
jgi:hypothetical protein